jgi:hypothetical protein
MTNIVYTEKLRLLIIAASAAMGSKSAMAGDFYLGVDAGYLRNQGVEYAGKLVHARLLHDKAGEHLLVLSARSAPSPSKPSARDEYHEIAAAYYGRKADHWQPEWTVRDMLDCPVLDSVVEFFPALVSVTDLNHDGRNEVTIPYRLFCAGSVDYSTVKVILRDGDTKLALRGELEFQPVGKPAIQGSRQYDPALLKPGNAVYRKQLDAVWSKVVRLQR